MVYETRFYLDDWQHSFIIVWISLDLEALFRISTDYRVNGSPCPRGWIVSVVYCQVYHYARRTLVYVGLKLLETNKEKTNHH